MAPLKLLAHLGTGHTPSRQHPEYWEDCTIPWLTLADVWQLRDGTAKVVTSTAELISGLGVAHSSAVVHPRGTVALSRTASVGFSCILGTSMATSQDFFTWTVGPRLDNRFLLWWLRGQRQEILALRAGSTHQTIYKPDIERVQVAVPPLAQQRAIADYLDTETARIDALIAKKRELVRVLAEKEARVLDAAMLSDGEVPRVRLSRLARLQGGLTVDSHRDDDEGTMAYPYLRVANVQPGRLDMTEVKEVRVPLALAARCRLQPGDVLMTEGGDIDKLGRGTVWRDEVPGCLHQNHIFAVRPDVDRLLPDYLALFTRTSEARRYFEQTGVQSTNLASTSASKVLATGIPLRSTREQFEIVDAFQVRANQILGATTRLTRQIDLLVEHRQALLIAAVTGELKIPGVAA